MKLTLRWLADFVDLPTTDPDQIAAAFEALGHEVDAHQTLRAEFDRVVIGRVTGISPHPDADKVRVCTVDVGDPGGDVEIVCGAWNFDVGAVVPVALPGARLGDVVIERRTIRSVVSNGMICSERELGLGDDHAGIMVLDADFPEVGERLGTDFAPMLDLPDVAFDVTITPNRPDCMSVLGLARELAAHYGIPVRRPEVVVTEEPGSATAATVAIADPVGCPRFVGREIRGVTVASSPLWMRLRLRQAGIRPINNVVDASNYAMVELGHPTHAFDLDRLGDTVVVRRATAGERIVTLDGQERVLLPVDMVVADGVRPVAIAGVMGGADTEVHTGSSRILVEAAHWDPPAVLHTSRRLGLRSEASARFERGMDPNLCAVAADRVAQLLVETAGATVAGRVDAYPTPIEPTTVALAETEIERHLGIRLEPGEPAELLERLGFAVSGGDPLQVEVPTRRGDVERPIDLIEEVARLAGFERIPDRVRTGLGGGIPPVEANRARLRRFMQGAGYSEIFAFSFIGAADLDALALPADDRRRSGIPVLNPLHDDHGVMRTMLLPGLIAAAVRNINQHIDDVALFETGTVFLPGPDPIPDQPEHLGFIRIGAEVVDFETEARPVDVRNATGLWEGLVATMGIPDATIHQTVVPELHPGRAAEVRVGGDPVGVVGELHPAVADRSGLPGRVVVGEIDIEPLVAAREPWRLVAPSQFPPNIFDLAFEIVPGTAVGDLLAAIRSGAGDLFESQRVFDVFSGGPVAAGHTSVAVRVTLRARDRTLTDQELAPVRRSIVDVVASSTGARLRGEV